jgi:hypothetical protein
MSVDSLIKPEDSTETVAPKSRKRRVLRTAIIVTTALVLAAVTVLGTLFFVNRPTNFTGKSAATLANAIGCTNFVQEAKHNTTVYHYNSAGTCVLGNVTLRVTTFDNQADTDAFATLLRGLIPTIHPKWVGATYAAGNGWNVADSINLTAAPAVQVVKKLEQGKTYVIPS